MLERSLDFSFAAFLVLFSLPLLVLRTPYAQLRPARRRKAFSAGNAPVNEFAFERAIAAYEDLIDAMGPDSLQ